MFGARHFGKAYFGGRYFGPPADGALTYTYTDVTVRAIATGYIGGVVRAVGETFAIQTPAMYHPSWMEFVDSPPADWEDELEARNITAENLRVEFRGRDEDRTTEEAFGV